MAISTHQLYLVLRARDEASRVLATFGGNMSKLGALQQAVVNSGSAAELRANRAALAAETARQNLAKKQMAIGSGLATLGVAVAAGGLLALNALNKMTNAAMDYNQQTSLTLTQVDKAKVSFNDLWRIGLNIGKTVPVAFDDIQKSLYDIFSSITTDGPGAQKILDAIARAAVGGQTSMQIAGRAIIAVLNAYKMPANAAVKVSDVLFQLVRKGVGTYQQFTEVIGRAIPSALKSGQSIENLAGMMAFLTRNGLSAANATASASRALDALSKPSAVKKLHAIGVEVADSAGNFRPIVDIMADMREKMKNLTPIARALKLNDIFKGAGGTAQAFRFFNLGIDDSKQLLKEMTTDMHNAGGAAKQAYDIMANTPQAKIDLLNNKYKAMKITIGNQLIPAKLKLVEILTKLLGWWEKLAPSTQRLIVKIIAISAAVAVLLGIFISITGVVLLFMGAIALAGPALGTVLLIISGVGLALLALGVAIFFIIKYWDTIKAKSVDTWNAVYNAISPIIDQVLSVLIPAVISLGSYFVNVFNNIVSHATSFVAFIVSKFGPTVTKIFKIAVEAWNQIYGAVSGAVSKIVPAIASMISNIKKQLDKWAPMLAPVQEALMHIWHAVIFVAKAITDFGALIISVLSGALAIVMPIIRILALLFINTLASAIKMLTPVVIATFQTIGSIVGSLLNIIRNFIMIFVNLINGDWGKAWKSVVALARSGVSLTIAIVAGLPRALLAIIKGLVTGIIDWFKRLWHDLVGGSIVPDTINAIIRWWASLPGRVISIVAGLVSGIIGWFLRLPGAIMRAISNLPGQLFSFAAAALGAFKNGLTVRWGDVVSWVGGIPSRLLTALGKVGGALYGAGLSIMGGLKQGLIDGAKGVAEAAKKGLGKLASFLPFSPVKEGPLKVLNNGRAGKNIMKMIQQGIDASERLNIPSVNFSDTGYNGSSANSPTPVGGSSRGPGNDLGNNSKNVSQNFFITTQEIDPRKHAADLGWELSTRV